MKSSTLRMLAPVVFVLLIVGSGPNPVAAQQQRTLVVREGKMMIDGREVNPQSLPPSLDLNGKNVNFSFSYSGTSLPHVVLDGMLFRVADDRLIELHPVPGADRESSFFFFGEPGQLSGRLEQVLKESLEARTFAEAQAVALKERAQDLSQLSEDIARRQQDRQRGMEKAMEEMRLQVMEQADRSARMAEMMPQIEERRYLNGMQERDRALFEALIREHRLEAETVQLAAKVHESRGEERRRQTEILRQKLEEIFEIKQENRRREILELESQLEETRRNLQVREEKRNEIIERRMIELIGRWNHLGE